MAIPAVNPAIGFLKQGHRCTAEQLVRKYASYLLHEANAYRLPVNLELIRKHFGLPATQRKSLPGQRGLVNKDDLRIYLNADDPLTVQQFTFGHEYIELLFLALNMDDADSWVDDVLYENLVEKKERLCDAGAAELLMPLALFREVVPRPLHLTWAQHLAESLQLSLTATLWRVFETELVEAVLVIWRYGHAPREFVPSVAHQLNLFGAMEAMDPPRKLRVLKKFAPSSDDHFIPQNKSAPSESSIYQAYDEVVATSGFDTLDLVGLKGTYFVESFPFDARGERHVMSLIHLRDPHQV